MTRWKRLTLSLATLAACSAASTAWAQATPQLNRLEKATVRVFACRSLSLERIEREGQEVYLAVPEVGHGSGLMVTDDGLILTARHVVQEVTGLAVKLPLAREAIPAVVVYEDPTLDFAFIKVQGTFTDHVPLPREGSIKTLVTRDKLFSIGYPLDPSASTPTTQEGIVSRVTEEGLLQTSAALNPGHSGGPAFVDSGGQSHLIGIAVARHRLGEGMGLIVPIGPAVQAYNHDIVPRNLVATALERYQRDPRLWETMRRYSIVVAEMTEAFHDQSNPAFWFQMPRSGPNGVPAFLRELESLAVDSMLPEAQLLVSGYLWNLFVATRDETALRACIEIVAHLRENNPDVFARSTFAQGLMHVVEAVGAMSETGPTTTGSLEPDTMSCGNVGVGCCSGRYCIEGLRCIDHICVMPQPCNDDQPCPGGQICRRGTCDAAPPFPLFRLGVAAGMAIDDHANAPSAVDGGGGGVIGLFQPLRLGHRTPWAFALIAGAELSVGAWRQAVTFSGLVDLGVRFLIGSPRVAAVMTLLYTPGVIIAEGRTSGVYLAYRAMLGVQLGRFEIGVSWRESGRTADSTFRALELVASWGIR